MVVLYMQKKTSVMGGKFSAKKVTQNREEIEAEELKKVAETSKLAKRVKAVEFDPETKTLNDKTMDELLRKLKAKHNIDWDQPVSDLDHAHEAHNRAVRTAIRNNQEFVRQMNHTNMVAVNQHLHTVAFYNHF